MATPPRSRASARLTPARPDGSATTSPIAGHRYLTVREAADYLNTSERFVRRIIADRRIAFHKLGSHVRISTGDLDAFLRAGRVEPVTVASFYGGAA